jgi:hypothetical protein
MVNNLQRAMVLAQLPVRLKPMTPTTPFYWLWPWLAVRIIW